MTSDATASDDDRRQALRRGFAGFDIRTATSADGTRIGYRVAGTGEAVLLIHGFPQSGYEFRDLAAALARDHRVIVPDYRGAAGSDVPPDGYDKRTMAADLRAVVLDADAGPAHVIGHDIGTTLAFAYARDHTDAVSTLTLVDGIVPGTATLQGIVASGHAWHFGFHREVALATALIQGRERVYVDWMIDGNTVDPTTMGDEDRGFYARGLARPGATAAAMQTYATWFQQDASDNQDFLARVGKLTLPVLAVGGQHSLGPFMAAVAEDVATDVTSAVVADAGHFVPEEQPEAFEQLVRKHLAQTRAS